MSVLCSPRLILVHHTSLLSLIRNIKVVPVQSMKAYGWLEVAAFIFNLVARRTSIGQLHTLVPLHPGKETPTHWTGGWVGPRSGLDSARREDFLPLSEIDPRLSNFRLFVFCGWGRYFSLRRGHNGRLERIVHCEVCGFTHQRLLWLSESKRPRWAECVILMGEIEMPTEFW